jgi:Spy/CpxP family protein refolding chaperone
MKTKTPVLLGALALALLSAVAIAATTNLPPPAAPATPAPDSPRDDFRARILNIVGLNADQQKRIDELRAQQRAELQALNGNKDLAPDARREKARAIVENYRTQMRAVLTPDQQKKVDEWRAHMAQRGRGAGWSGQGRHPGSDAQRGPAMQPPGNPLAIVAMGERIKDQMAERLQLTDEQRDKLEHLGRAYRAQQRDLAKKHLEEMRAVLTPEQQKKARNGSSTFAAATARAANTRLLPAWNTTPRV